MKKLLVLLFGLWSGFAFAQATFTTIISPTTLQTSPTVVTPVTIPNTVSVSPTVLTPVTQSTSPWTVVLPTIPSSNYTWAPGTSFNGLTNGVITFLTTELQSLGQGQVTSSSVAGNSGVFTSLMTSQSIWSECFYDVGNPAVATPGAGANLTGWFATSLDGSTFESIGTSLNIVRSPDFIIPIPATTPTINTIYKAPGLVRLPALNFKVVILNNAANALGSGATTAPYLKCGPVAVQQ